MTDRVEMVIVSLEATGVDVEEVEVVEIAEMTETAMREDKEDSKMIGAIEMIGVPEVRKEDMWINRLESSHKTKKYYSND